MSKIGVFIGSLILFHAAYSMIEYRKYSQEVLNDENYAVPLDIIIEAMAGMIINLIAGSYMFSNFMPLKAGLATKINHDLRPLAKTKACVFKKMRKIPTLQDAIKQYGRIEKLYSRYSK